jgi:hypothetical protein
MRCRDNLSVRPPARSHEPGPLGASTHFKLMLERTHYCGPGRDVPRALRNRHRRVAPNTRRRRPIPPARCPALRRCVPKDAQKQKGPGGQCRPGPWIEGSRLTGRHAPSGKQCGWLVHVRARKRFATLALDAGAR